MQSNMMTYEKQTSLFGRDELMSLQAGFPVRMRALQNNMELGNLGCSEKEPDSHSKCSAPLMKYGPIGWCRKMSQISSMLTEDGTLREYSIDFPQWGTVSNGKCFTHQISVFPISVPGATWLLTPIASDYMRANLSSPMYGRRLHRSCGSLPEQLARFGFRGTINYRFPLTIMGYPTDYLDSVLNQNSGKKSLQQ